MAFNGAGVYELPAPPTFPAVAGTKIRASYFNSTINDIATALSNCIARDGQSTITGTQNFLDVNVTGDILVTGDVLIAGRSVITRRWATGEYIITASPTAPSGTVAPNGGDYRQRHLTCLCPRRQRHARPVYFAVECHDKHGAAAQNQCRGEHRPGGERSG